jgi:hypothetical protein
MTHGTVSVRKPMFTEPIEAWANGPVVYELFQQHRPGDPDKLDSNQQDTGQLPRRLAAGLGRGRLVLAGPDIGLV